MNKKLKVYLAIGVLIGAAVISMGFILINQQESFENFCVIYYSNSNLNLKKCLQTLTSQDLKI